MFDWFKKRRKKDNMPVDPFDSPEQNAPEYIVEQYFDEQRGLTIWVELVCTCGLPVARKGEDSFYCLHCDEGCEEDPAACKYCQYAMMDREEAEDEF